MSSIDAKVLHIYQTSFLEKKGGIQQHVEALSCRTSSADLITHQDISSFHIMGQYIPYKFWQKSFMRKIKDNNILHAHGFANVFTYLVLLYVMIIKKKNSYKLIYTPHAHEISTHRHPRLVGLFVKYIAIRVLNKMSEVICLTKHEKKMLISYGLNESLVKVIPNGHLVEVRSEGKYNTKNKSIMFIGRNVPNKRLETVNKLQKFFTDNGISVKIVSSVSDQDRVQGFSYYSDLSNEDLMDKISKSDIILVPSSYESFGLVVLESLACGTPVVVSDKVMVKEYIDKLDFCKVAKVDDVNEFKIAIQHFMMLNDSEYKNCSDAAVKYASSMSWDNIVSCYYKEVY